MPKRHNLVPTVYQYTYGPNEPQLWVQPGDTVVAKTRDAHGFDENGRPLPEPMRPRIVGSAFCESNPCVGPICVEGAEPGDTLVVRIKRIKLNRATAWSRHLPRFGSFTGEGPGRHMLLNDPIGEVKYDWQLDLQRKVGILQLRKSRLKRIEIPLHPFLGSIGVAPRFGRVETTLTPGDYGGNMDCIETHEGTTLYLPVWAPGAYLEFGDVHAAQGDGEVCGVALETTAEVTVTLNLVKGKSIEWPRLEDRTHLMTAGNARPLLDAAKIAHLEMVRWLENDYGFEKWEAFQVLSQVGTMRVGNVCDPNYTVIAKFPKEYLP